MEFRISVIFALIFCFFGFAGSAVLAQEATDDWGSLMKDYSGSNNFGKIISDTEYKKAIETKESFIKKSKKDKKKLKEGTATRPIENAMLEIPESPCPLLVLTADVCYENLIIRQGFYLVNLINDGEKYFLELRQGNKIPVAVIEAKGHIAPGKSILQPQISVENVDDKIIKINYSGDNLILETVLWKY